jgi:hypothetical protein
MAPSSLAALLRLFGRIEHVREHRAQRRRLVRLARRFTPAVSARVAALVQSDHDEALSTFISSFQHEHFELDEAICDDGFNNWADGAGTFIPMLMRGTDRCNGLEPFGYRPGLALMWALIQDVFYGDERAELIAEVALEFGEALADRLQAADPPRHAVLRRRIARTAYAGVFAFSCWALGSVQNPLLLHHAHHADELLIPWTVRGVARAARLVRQANDFEASILALARWVEQAPGQHGQLLCDAVLGPVHAKVWTPEAIQPCPACGFPHVVRTHLELTIDALVGPAVPHPRCKEAPVS